jgi:hypothetical protein
VLFIGTQISNLYTDQRWSVQQCEDTKQQQRTATNKKIPGTGRGIPAHP